MPKRIPDVPPVIKPVEAGMLRPRWSVMIPSYNCSQYLEKTITSVLSQDLGEDKMQIEVIDDFSTDDDVAKLVRQVGKGRIVFFQQTENVGSLRNFETCLKRSKGELVHILHGDDIVKSGFYNEIERLFSNFQNIGAGFTRNGFIDEKDNYLYSSEEIIPRCGIVENWLQRIAQRQLLQAPAMVVKRSVYEQLGSFFAVEYGEDWEMWVRIAAHFPVAYSPKTLALYRIHTNNISSNSFFTGNNIQSIKKVIDIIQKYLPKDDKRLLINAKHHFASYFSNLSYSVSNNTVYQKAALKQAYLALKLHTNKTTANNFLRLTIKLALIKLKKGAQQVSNK